MTSTNQTPEIQVNGAVLRPTPPAMAEASFSQPKPGLQPPLMVIPEEGRLNVSNAEPSNAPRVSRAHIFEADYENETADERRQREERENAEKNEFSIRTNELINMLREHNQNIDVHNNINVNRNQMKAIRSQQSVENGSICSGDTGHILPDEDFNYRDEFARTTSMVATGPGEVQAMSRQYKMVTSGALWFCYFSLALNDYIFGPTFADLSEILEVTFDKIAYFAVFRQFAYTLGSLGGVGFNYVNRQMALVAMLIVSGVTLFLTPYSPSLGMFYFIAVLNGFAAGACDVGFHVWILEMFQNGGGPLLQALHFSFGIGIAVAPLITASFLTGESDCGGEAEHEGNSTLVFKHRLTEEEIAIRRETIFVPYAIIGAIVCFGGILLGGLYFYKKYIPPKERKLPVSFDEQMPKQLTRLEKMELWKKSVPSFYIILIISLGSCLCFAYYGLEVTYFQFLAQFTTAVPLPIEGAMAANLEAATGSAYAIGGFIAMMASLRFHPERMIYVNFIIMNVGGIILQFSYQSSLPLYWVAHIVIGFGFSSCYATAYTFLEHQINVTNLIGSIFLFAGGLGTAIFPLILSSICQHPEYLIYLAFFAMNIALLLFILMHFMTTIRGKQVKLIKNQLLKSPAMLTQFKERTLSTLSYVSNFY